MGRALPFIYAGPSDDYSKNIFIVGLHVEKKREKRMSRLLRQADVLARTSLNDSYQAFEIRGDNTAVDSQAKTELQGPRSLTN